MPRKRRNLFKTGELSPGETLSMSYKSSSEMIVIKTLRTFLICRLEYFTPAMQQLLANPDEHLDESSGPFFKNISGDTSTVGVVIVDHKKFVVKRYNLRGFWYNLKKLFRGSRALRSWKNSRHLEQHHIPTPRPVAVLIKHFGPIRRVTYFIAEYVEGVQGRDLFAEDSKFDADWEKALKNVLELLKQLHAARITHDDFQHRNMIFTNDVPVLLDLDHMRIHGWDSIWFRHNFRKDADHFLSRLDEVNPKAHGTAKTILNSLTKGR
jgi:tRNA A-37 threonylcarbamoyl transferase component Bud32